MGISEKQVSKWLIANPDLQLVNEVTLSRQRERNQVTGPWFLNVPPLPKPRMVNSDRWRKRPSVQRYWQWKDKIVAEAANQGLVLPPTFRAIFYIAMPNSWPKRRKAEMAGREHTQTPDTDNLLKALKDALCVEDSHIWHDAPIKVWSWKPGIYIEEVKPQPLLDYAALVAERYGL